MNTMHKLVFVAVALGLVALSVGCQSGLSEERVKDIVEEEVASQLAAVDELTVSDLLIENEDGQIVAGLGSVHGVGILTIGNADGEIVGTLGSVDGEGKLIIGNADDEIVVILASSDGDGLLEIYDKYGWLTFEAP